MLNINNLFTTAALTAVENKIANVSNLVKKTDYNTKISELEKKITPHDRDKYITIPEFNKAKIKKLFLFPCPGENFFFFFFFF